jgi:hypothetical protein
MMFSMKRRSMTARAGAATLAIGALVALGLPGASAATSPSPSPFPSSSASGAASVDHTKCVSKGLSTTCTGSHGGDNAYNPWTGTQISNPPVVTVSQTKDLTDQVVNVSWQYFTPSISGSQFPNPGVGSGGAPKYYDVSVYECRGTNPVWNSDGLADSCDETGLEDNEITTGVPNAAGGVTLALDATKDAAGDYEDPGGIPENLGDWPADQGWGGPSSATGGNPATWKGQAQFHIEVGQENSQLGCDASSPCSLAIVPNFGGAYSDVPGTNAPSLTDTSQCEDHVNDDPTDSNINGPFPADALNSYACGIMDRIIVPLSFAPTAANCPNQNVEFYAQGSPMLQRAMTQWQSGFCTGSAPVELSYNSADSESQARSAFLQGGRALSARVDMAMVTLPADAGATQGSSRKFTYAPLANSGVAIADYLTDPNTGQQINHVVLNPRLVAKLTTESYSLGYGCTSEPFPEGVVHWPPLPNASSSCDPAVTHNPPSLYDDPEFLSVNKDCQPAGESKNYVCGASDFPSDSIGNMLYGPFLPTVLAGDSDMTYQLTDWVAANSDAAAFLDGKVDPWDMHVNSYYLHAVSYPTEFFQTLDPGATFPIKLACSPNPKIGCSDVLDYEYVGTMNAAWNPVTDLSHVVDDLLEYQPTADIPSLVCPSTVADETCTTVDQLQFESLPAETSTDLDLYSELDLGDVAAYQFPTAAPVNAAGKAVAPTQASVEAAVKDMKTNPDGITQYANESSSDPNAYPLAMVDYAMVPTCGLSSSEASAIADFLDKVATTGQTQGYLPGDLAPGYYPLTAKQKAQTLQAAQEVKSQDCKTAPPDKTVSGHKNVNDTTTSSPGNNHSGNTGTPSTKAHKKAPSSTVGTPTGSATTPKAQTAAFGQKSPDSGMAGVLQLLAIIIGALLLVGGSAAWAITATGKWPVVLRWLRPVQTRLRTALAWLGGLVVRRA